MYITDGISEETTMTFGEMEMGQTATLNLYCSPKQAEKLALQLLESVKRYKEKYPHKYR